MVSIPVPMNPNANNADAQWPATGFNAAAACVAEPIFFPCKVDAVATMMANITALENPIPMNTSPRLVRSLYFGIRRGAVLQRHGPVAAFWLGP